MTKKPLIFAGIALLVLTTVVLWAWLETRRPQIGASVVDNGDKESLPVEEGWRIYKNGRFDFGVNYPENLVVDENDQWPDFFQVYFRAAAPEAPTFQVKVRAVGKSTEPFNIYLDTESQSEVILDNKRAALFVLENGYCDGPGCTQPIVAFKLEMGGNHYILEFHGIKDPNDKFIQSIVQGFHLVPTPNL